MIPRFRRSSGRVHRVALLVAIIAVQFALFETALRLWGSSEAAPAFQGLFVQDSDVGFRLKPGARIRFATAEFDTEIAVNNVGVRDDEDLGPKASNERRIVVLGDSMVLSVQVPQQSTFVKLLEQRLNVRASGQRYRVINAGVQGYGPIQEWLLFRKLAAALDPDVVIVTIFVGDDAEDAYASRSMLAPVPRRRAERLADTLVTRLRRVVRRSMVLQILRTRVLTVANRFRVRAVRPEPPLQTYAAHPAPRIATGIEVARNSLNDIAALAATRGARTAVVLMPARFQLVDEDYEYLRRDVTESGGELLRDAASERFASMLSGLGLPWLDLLPALRQVGAGGDLFFRQNIHLTPRGHQVVAAALEQFLVQQGLAGGTAGGERPH